MLNGRTAAAEANVECGTQNHEWRMENVTLQPSEESANRGQRLVWHSRDRLCLPALAPKTATAGAAVPHTSHSAEVLLENKKKTA